MLNTSARLKFSPVIQSQFRQIQNQIFIQIQNYRNLLKMSNNSIAASTNGKGGKNIKVFVRVRPFNDKQNSQRGCISSVSDNNISIKQTSAKQPLNFAFDGIFQSDATQSQVYEAVGSQIVNQAFNGINGTVFCYGQTSSGKTHTCVGPDFKDSTNSGILPRLIKQTLCRIQMQPKNIQAKMKISMVEIYNQKIKDLIDPNKIDLKIRSNKKQGIFLQNLTQKYILAQQEAFHYLSIGINNRAVNATNMNNQSSRSHMVFIITLNTHDVYSGEAKSSKIILVDLAGSEKISKTGAEGKVLQQAKKINTSLTTLGKVINSLSDQKCTHVPYRDSKLTRLLQQSLGGNSITNLIVNVSPSSYNQSQTLTSIRFGQRAKCIKNAPIVNKSYTMDQLLALLKKAEQTIQKQNMIIKELSKKKRSGGYGALSIPTMITMHMIDDQQENDKSVEADGCNKQNIDQQNLIQFRKSQNSLASQQLGLKCSIKQNVMESIDDVPQLKNRKAKKCQTLTQFPGLRLDLQEIKSNNISNSKIENKQDQKSKNSIGFQEDQDLLYDYANKFMGSQIGHHINFPTPIIQDQIQENKQTPRNFPTEQKNYLRLSVCEDLSNTEHNLDKIRQNLFELKLRYMQEKRQNSIKTMIIERKNKVIQNSKFAREKTLMR